MITSYKRLVRERTMVRLMLVALAILICAGLLTACDTGQSAPASSSAGQPTTGLPLAIQAKPTPIPPPTITPVPTAVPIVLIQATHPVGEEFHKGNPPSLQQDVNDLATFEAGFEPKKGSVAGASSGSGGQAAATTAARTTAPTTSKPGVGNPTPAPVRTIRATPLPAGTGVFGAGSWQVSNNTNDIFLDTYNQYLIVGLIVSNKGKASASFSSLGLQVQFGGVGTSKAESAAVAQAYLDANGLNSASVGTIYTPLAAGGFKVLYAAFRSQGNSQTRVTLSSTTPKGLLVPLN